MRRSSRRGSPWAFDFTRGRLPLAVAEPGPLIERAVEIAAGLADPGREGEYVDVRPIADGVADLDL